MEVFFLDVGQASCNIILLGDRRAIVIDSGSGKGSLPLKFLKRCRVDRIAALVVTHSDHIGGATCVGSSAVLIHRSFGKKHHAKPQYEFLLH